MNSWKVYIVQKKHPTDNRWVDVKLFPTLTEAETWDGTGVGMRITRVKLDRWSDRPGRIIRR